MVCKSSYVSWCERHLVFADGCCVGTRFFRNWKIKLRYGDSDGTTNDNHAGNYDLWSFWGNEGNADDDRRGNSSSNRLSPPRTAPPSASQPTWGSLLERGRWSLHVLTLTASPAPGSEVLPEDTAQCFPPQGPRGRTEHWDYYHHFPYLDPDYYCRFFHQMVKSLHWCWHQSQVMGSGVTFWNVLIRFSSLGVDCDWWTNWQ